MPVTILMIDDESLCLDSMGIILEETKFNLILAEGGVAGLNYVNAKPQNIDIILLDMMMPDMHGLEVLAAIKNNPHTKHIPVIIQSGVATDGELKKAMDLGATFNLRKPFKRKEILEALEIVLNIKAAEVIQ